MNYLLPHLMAGETEAQSELVNCPDSHGDSGPLTLTEEVLMHVSTEEALFYLPGAILSTFIS